MDMKPLFNLIGIGLWIALGLALLVGIIIGRWVL